MSEPIRPMLRHGHVSVTRITQDGTVHEEVHISEVSYAAGAVGDVTGEAMAGGGDAARVASPVRDVALNAVEGIEAMGIADSDGGFADNADNSDGVCFDPETCCGARERAMIAMLRAYLRPEVAPECLLAKLHATLDRCCYDDEEQRAVDNRSGCQCQ